MEHGYRALAVMENHLEHQRFFAAERYTVADIALYAYTHLAHLCDLRSRHLSGDPRLARSRGGTTALCADGLAAGDSRGGIGQRPARAASEPREGKRALPA